MVDLNKVNKIFFVGIGGIGISATAGIAHSRHFLVEGSDASESEIVADLRLHQIPVHVPHRAENISEDFQLVVYSVAVPADNPELIRAKELKIPLVTYPQFLGLLIKDKYGIGVSGTDGKTTTTAMLAKIMIDAGTDPTVVLGSKAEFLEDNWRCGEGNGKYFIFEADEYRRAFDNYNPKLAIFTNIGVDHLDYFTDQVDYLSAFKKYAKKMPKDGVLIINNDDDNCVEAGLRTGSKLVTYAIERPADFMIKEIRIVDGRQEFSVLENGEAAGAFTFQLPGKYNVYNSLSAIAAARQLDIGWETIIKSIDSFKGTWRRFERLGRLGNTEVIADYAHTPDAVGKVINAVKEFFPNKKILFVFQPHQYARTKNLFSQFVEALCLADKVIIPDIFYVEGREKPEDFDVSSEKLAGAINDRNDQSSSLDYVLARAIYGGNLESAEREVRKIASDFDIVMVLGAGNVYELAKNLVKMKNSNLGAGVMKEYAIYC